jgi:hypothetical protein
MKKPEQTSARVARIAGKVLANLEGCAGPDVLADHFHKRFRPWGSHNVQGKHVKKVCTVGELKALAASALTQAPDKTHGKRPRT